MICDVKKNHMLQMGGWRMEGQIWEALMMLWRQSGHPRQRIGEMGQKGI
jgi:hypothetical protein